MDLTEGTYSASQLPLDMSEEQSAMESDYCPDPQQYQLPPDNRPPPEQPTQEEIRSDFCTTYCGYVNRGQRRVQSVLFDSCYCIACGVVSI